MRVKAHLDLHAHEDVRRVDRERRLGHDRAAHVHERMEKVAEYRAGAFKRNDKRVALQLLIGQVEQGDDADQNVSDDRRLE